MFIKGRKLNVLTVFTRQFYLKVSKGITKLYRFFINETYKQTSSSTNHIISDIDL